MMGSTVVNLDPIEYLKFGPEEFWIKWTDPSGKRYCRTAILRLLKKDRHLIEKVEM